MMTEKKKKIKIGKLNKGRVTRNPELVIMYDMLERMNSYEELRGLIQRAFEKDRKRKSEKFLKTMLRLILK